MGVPALIGWVLDRYCKLGGEGQPAYDYTIPMAILPALAFWHYLLP